ncbi:RNA polymerase sigma factor SigF [Synechococcus elongatus]|uniref:Group3 RNA polymerase sigma factor SigF n=2 Tax=Synechococcus elongatus TaxID=32046 RepID=Q31N29_SYNE7|nr:RNA polymerase sigma factor SigF [Synechococcus elongatus]MBD2689493.1 RNA polymerase sigma factor SigF [Synechococcus elongatus FACHB-1061]ABB57540.1 group3 RNA polymerase sigma factor SigF [Synechococcus elongatus PCC 7942 = FACHB-805]AJD57888.1 RNA polymerase sigma factor SigF [Synechococcus elongatus UTEX 2973]MBD2588344.1 RNA polymerase sigma factor SigF [Synechococcus elongatus FACHB-242]MBD2708088.1 RNA polymerase sigma factor SigF [Synechococcus elongatus PCC 7942 = FACHB-805]
MGEPLSSDPRRQTFLLLRQYQQTRDHRIRNRLVELNLGLVRQEAYRWVQRCPESFEELVQIGSLGLIAAIDRFELERGKAFSSFAVPYIRGEIQHYLRDRSGTVRVPRRWAELHQQIDPLRHKLQRELGRSPTEEELRQGLGLDAEEWQEVRLIGRNRTTLSLDQPLYADEEQVTSLGDSIADPKYRSFQLAEEDRIRLQQAMQLLEQRTREILEFVFFYDLTQREVAEKLGLSAVTVSRQVKKGLKHLKSILRSGDDA